MTNAKIVERGSNKFLVRIHGQEWSIDWEVVNVLNLKWPWEARPHEEGLYAIFHTHGLACIVAADNPQDALDLATGEGFMSAFQVSEGDIDEDETSFLGNESTPHDLSDMHMFYIDVEKIPQQVTVAFAEAIKDGEKNVGAYIR